ncbi:MAG: hypothetical protein PW789_17630 [Edaphobacter sp.]|uniref:hypothetical protein n=1 Tax=Edaphobacter sp. TaxID=1934404 RepID=UPI002399A24D|nr:hypothetical protein [Edaphobacter sp.]MDE1178398.1 hypothetical protein [Edaphobacter sp.]
MITIRTGFLTAVVLWGASGAVALAQRQSTPVAPQPSQLGGSMSPMNSGRGNFPMDSTGSSMPDVLSGRMTEQQTKTRNNERQKRLESDTDKLVGLVNDLKNQVGQEKSLTPEELNKRAEEIEKLARSVKDRMKG